MTNWNLSVDLRGHGNDLAQSLKSAAKHARTLGTAARTAKTEVRELGTASAAATRHIRTLGTTARTTARRLNTLGNDARTAARQMGRYGDAARTANRHVNSLGDNSRTTGRQLARMSGQIDTAVRDLLRLAQAAQRASTHMRTVGAGGTRGLRQMTAESGRLRHQLTGLAALMSGGALVMGFSGMLKHGNEYQQSLNTFGAVTGATQMQMQRASATAKQLGGDLSLPAVTASDAAEAMVELAKAGFRTDQAITATRASLTLAAAAGVKAGDSAKYLGDMMDQFGMGADQSARAADILAATANSASGNITDIYYAMKYAGPVAHGLGVSMEDAAAAVGMLGKAGILGQTAGTTLRGMFSNLAAPTKQMTTGLNAMGIEAWDAQGNFKGLRYVIDGLAKAEKSMSQKDFAAAVKQSMGKPAMSGAIALAHQGVTSFDALHSSVTSVGAATDIAAAKGKGLAGAMVQLKSKSEQAGLALYDGMAPGLEFLIRGLTSGISKATPLITSFFGYINDSATLFGPDIAAAARRQFSSIGDAAKGMIAPFKELGGNAVASALHVLLSAGQMVVDVLKNLAAGVEPVVSALGNVAGEGKGVASTLDIVVFALDAAAQAVSFLSKALGPIGHLVGGLVSVFGSLPGPVQSAVLAMLLMRRVGPIAQGVAGSVGGRLTGAFRSLNQQMALQRTLAASSGASIGRYGAAFAVLQARVPVIGRMGASFRTAAGQATGFGGALRGVTAAAGTGLRSAMGGLMGVMGGPWGVALTAATVGLGMLATRQQKAAAAAAEHQQQISSLAQALRESNGAVNDNVRAIAAETLMGQKVKTTLDGQQRLVDLARKAKVPMSQLVDAYTNQGTSLSALQRELAATAEASKFTTMDENGSMGKAFTVQGRAADDLRKALGPLGGDFQKAAADAKAFNEGVNGAGKNVTAYDRLRDAVGALADKTKDADSRTRALRDALDLLSGGSISLQAAQARVHEAVTNANEALATGIDKANGWGKALVGTKGALDTTTKNGQQLFSTLDTIADSSSSAAVAAYSFAQSQRKTVPESIKAARKEMQDARDAAIKLAEGYGLVPEQAAGVADAMGLIPGRVSILLQTEGVDTALADLLAVKAEFERFPDKKTVKVDALGDEAKKELEAIGYQIELIPGTREYKITAPTQAARAELDLLITKLGQTNGKTLNIKAPTGKVKAELQSIQDKVKGTKGKTLTIKAPTTEARQHLEALGFKIKNTKGKTVTITVPTGDATRNAAIIQNAIDNIRGKSVSIYLNYKKTGNDRDANGVPDMVQAPQARGSVLSFYANGGTNRRGIRENHTAQIAPAGAWRVWAEEETGGEAYIPLSPSKRGRSRAITEETIRRLGGDPKSVQWHADGAVVAFDSGGFSYTPTGMRRDTSYVQSAYSDSHQPIDKDTYNKKIRARKNAVDSLRSAEAALAALRRKKHTHAQMVAAENRVAKARRTLATATDAARKAESRYKKTFSLSDWQKTLKSAVSANASYEANLSKIASRGGADVIGQLRDLGEEGAAMIAALAKASKKQFNDILGNLRKLGPLAKASLADYTKQLNTSNKTSTTFQANLAKLASMGYGDLATQLAGQGDEAAQKLAAEAVKNKGKASSANAAAKTSGKQLSGDELEQLIQIIAAVKTSKTGLHSVADTTGLGEDEIITVANKATAQIKSSLGSRSTQFLADLARANKGLSYANGGIREGIYATRGGAVTFAEPSTGGEAFIPLGPGKRTAATKVLRDVAGRFGVGLTDMSATRPVVIVQGGGDTNVNVTAVRTGASASDIGAQVGRSVRRARRGGVNARAAA
ncbi:phage tail tape measure protein [Streptomyces sp. NBC_01221]|uniref:phage tail tape measure protein n=1 Tax=Streptomyces sp. NBC_01221 TaxID=2903782 RepID=UPI00225589E7|nr:phage tail tape measure protein [Streptomyces sp. NBC_01221]MCX4792488.1 phage tail tape measure protein [Streptomyces sp. NBC_01221]